MVRAVGRLVLLAFVMVVVLVTASALGFPGAAVLGLAITTTGLVGMVSLARRGAAERRAGPLAAEPETARLDAMRPSELELRSDAGLADDDVTSDPVVAAMSPSAVVDPESLMPRWRRPSLLAARRADPTRTARVERTPMRFGPAADPSPNRRVVRYAMVVLLDRPDEVTGRHVSDLMSGDEVEVLDSGGPFWEVLCPDGLRGWVHRTTLSLPSGEHQPFGRRAEPISEPDDILTAVLSARGIR